MPARRLGSQHADRSLVEKTVVWPKCAGSHRTSADRLSPRPKVNGHSRLAELEARCNELKPAADRVTTAPAIADLEREVRRINAALDDRGRWISTYGGEPLVGQPKFPVDAQYISSEVFSRNMMTLSDYLVARARSPVSDG